LDGLTVGQLVAQAGLGVDEVSADLVELVVGDPKAGDDDSRR
jgi:hypothetical protein